MSERADRRRQTIDDRRSTTALLTVWMSMNELNQQQNGTFGNAQTSPPPPHTHVWRGQLRHRGAVKRPAVKRNAGHHLEFYRCCAALTKRIVHNNDVTEANRWNCTNRITSHKSGGALVEFNHKSCRVKHTFCFIL